MGLGVTEEAALPAGTVRSLPRPVEADEPLGRIGPNALIQAAAALRAHHGVPFCEQVFREAGLFQHPGSAPETMVHEAEVVRLHVALVRLLGAGEASAIAQDAGERTAVYLLKHRIPRFAQRVLSFLPALVGANILCRAIARHAWTFVGSGQFVAKRGDPLVLTIVGGPLGGPQEACASLCAYYAATLHGVMAGALARRVTSTFTLRTLDRLPACETSLSIGARAG
ncbi:MAG: bacteriochlorophyll 4-vinyl reductase [Bosea sp. (in: a-proteobacteria)]|jgi:divinyl protochlorophyllide a 8-vinyl-reductase